MAWAFWAAVHAAMRVRLFSFGEGRGAGGLRTLLAWEFEAPSPQLVGWWCSSSSVVMRQGQQQEGKQDEQGGRQGIQRG